MKEKIVNHPASFKPSWFSYQGAVQGVLNSQGVDVGLAEVIAVSGYGWITNAMKKNLCPSVPSAFHRDVWAEIYIATENLGYKTKKITSGLFELDEDQKPTIDSVKNAEKQYREVKKIIEADHPLVMWGIPIPEYGIVNGIRGEDYIVSTFRSLIGQPDTPIHYADLMSPCGLFAMWFTEPKPLDQKQVIRNTLRLGYRLGTGDVPQLDNYALGPDAYDELIKNLTKEPFDENSHHGTGYTLACLMEAKWGIAEYLAKADELLRQNLRPMSEKYMNLHKLLNECHVLFPLGPGEMTPADCEKTAEILAESKKIEVDALEDLRAVLNTL